jgi:hypothetical protein
MNNTHLLIAFIITFILIYNYPKPIKYYHCSQPDNNTFYRTILKNNKNYQQSTKQDCDLHLLCKYKKTQAELKNYNQQGKVVFGIYNGHHLTLKKQLWKTLYAHYGDLATRIAPKSYVLPEDKVLFDTEYNGEIYIVKGEKHRQEALELATDYKKIIRSKYDLVQKYLTNPYLFNGLKFNVRIYLLLKITQFNKLKAQNSLKAYVYNDGIISYTKNKYKTSLIPEENICSYYDSKQHYDTGLPITAKQLETHIPAQYKIIFKNIKYKTQLMVKAVKNKITGIPNNTTCEIFGVDFFVDTNLDVFIMEVNKGPGMIPHNKVDKKLRTELYTNITDLAINNKVGNFIVLI